MTSPDDIDALAAEYVLGTLDAVEREQVAARRLVDEELNQAVVAWERRLGPLAETVPELAPPAGLFEAVQRRIGPAEPNANLRRSLRLWRSGALAATALAACLAIALALGALLKPQPSSDYVALLETGSNSVGFLMTLDPARKSLAVRPVAAKPQAGKSFELWLVAPAASPRSYGLVSATREDVKSIAGDLDSAERATWAVSIEPEGGSPTGKPTGPVVFQGRFSPLRS